MRFCAKCNVLTLGKTNIGKAHAKGRLYHLIRQRVKKGVMTRLWKRQTEAKPTQMMQFVNLPTTRNKQKMIDGMTPDQTNFTRQQCRIQGVFSLCGS